jgi:hypothetical protein
VTRTASSNAVLTDRYGVVRDEITISTSVTVILIKTPPGCGFNLNPSNTDNAVAKLKAQLGGGEGVLSKRTLNPPAC